MFPISDSDLRTHTRPIVNLTLIGLCTAAFVYGLTLGEVERIAFFYRFGLIPNEVAHGLDHGLLRMPFGDIDIASPISNWATTFTSMFIHGGWLHFLINMLFLWVFGDNIEDRFGHLKYLLFYLAAGVVAVWLQVAVSTMSDVPVIGASGAIAGVLGAYFVLYPRSRVRTLFIFIFIPFLVRIPAIILLGFWFFIQFLSGVGSLAPAMEPSGVAYWAHIGGFVLGVAVAIVYRIATGQGLRPRGPWRGPPRWPPEGPTEGPEIPQYWRGRRL
jgi:membrane associated rhomboid family serine protease